MKIIVYSMYMLFFISFYFEYSIFLYFPGKEVKICYIFFQLLYAFLYRFGATCTWVEWWELGCACLICYFRVYTVLPLFSVWIVTAFIFTTICNGNAKRRLPPGADIWAIGDDSLQYVISEFMQYCHYFRGELLQHSFLPLSVMGMQNADSHLGRISGPLGMTVCNMLFQNLYSIAITFGVNCYNVPIYHYL